MNYKKTLIIFLAISFLISKECIASKKPELIPLLKKKLEARPGDLTLGMKLGELYESEGKFEEALSLYRELLKKSPRHPKIKEKLFSLYKKLQMVDHAIEDFEKGEKYEILAEFFRWLKDYDKAAKNYELALKRKPNDIYLLKSLASLYRKGKLYDEAMSLYQKAKALDKGGATYYYKVMGEILAEQGKMEEAKDVWRKILALDPSNIRNYGILATIYSRWGMIEEAIDLYLKAREIGGIDYSRELANLYKMQMMWEDAISEYLLYLEKHPKSLSWVELEIFKIGKEESILSSVVNWVERKTKGSNNPILHLLLSNLYIRVGRPADAIFECERAFALRRDDGALYLKLAKRLKDFPNHAIRVYEKILNLPSDTHKPEAQFGIGEAYLSLDEYEGAISSFWKVITNYPRSELSDNAYFMIGEIYLEKLHKPGEALKFYKILVGEYPRSELRGEAKVKVGNCLLRIGKYEEAISKYREVLSKRGMYRAWDEARFMIGEAKFYQQNFSSALKEYQKLLDDYPGGAYANDALLRIVLIRENLGGEALKLYSEGCRFVNEGNYAEGRKRFSQIIKEYQKSGVTPYCYLSIGEIFERGKETASSIRVYRELIERYPHSISSFEARMRIAQLFLGENKLREALEEYLSIARDFQGSIPSILVRGKIKKLRVHVE